MPNIMLGTRDTVVKKTHFLLGCVSLYKDKLAENYNASYLTWQ